MKLSIFLTDENTCAVLDIGSYIFRRSSVKDHFKYLFIDNVINIIFNIKADTINAVYKFSETFMFLVIIETYIDLIILHSYIVFLTGISENIIFRLLENAAIHWEAKLIAKFRHHLCLIFLISERLNELPRTLLNFGSRESAKSVSVGDIDIRALTVLSRIADESNGFILFIPEQFMEVIEAVDLTRTNELRRIPVNILLIAQRRSEAVDEFEDIDELRGIEAARSAAEVDKGAERITKQVVVHIILRSMAIEGRALRHSIPAIDEFIHAPVFLITDILGKAGESIDSITDGQVIELAVSFANIEDMAVEGGSIHNGILFDKGSKVHECAFFEEREELTAVREGIHWDNVHSLALDNIECDLIADISHTLLGNAAALIELALIVRAIVFKHDLIAVIGFIESLQHIALLTGGIDLIQFTEVSHSNNDITGS